MRRKESYHMFDPADPVPFDELPPGTMGAPEKCMKCGMIRDLDLSSRDRYGRLTWLYIAPGQKKWRKTKSMCITDKEYYSRRLAERGWDEEKIEAAVMNL